jgi:hypothetical protein
VYTKLEPGGHRVRNSVEMAAMPELKTAASVASRSSGTIWSSRISALGCDRRE